MRLRFGIQKKAIAGISLLLMALAVSLMWISVYQGSREIRAELLKRGRVAAENLAYNAAYPTMVRDANALRDFVDGVMAEKEILYCGILDADGNPLAERLRPVEEMVSEGVLDEGITSSPEARNFRLDAIRSCDVGTDGVCADDAGIVHFRVPITIDPPQSASMGPELELYSLGGDVPHDAHDKEVIGSAVIGLTTHYVEETIGDLRDKMIWITAVAILVAMLIVSIVVRLSISPINELVVATGRIASGDYDSKVGESRNDEIGDLARSFNKMTADLKTSRDALVEKELLEALVVELRETQEQLVQAGKLAALGQLAAGVAHEINNPLAGIMGYAQLLTEKLQRAAREGTTSEDIPRFISYVENMEKQSQRCKHIVQNLLKFARASTQEEMSEVDCNRVIQETLGLIEHQLEQSSIDVVTQFDPQLPPIYGQEGKLQQVITNIVINAMQAIEQRGTITISTSRHQNSVLMTIRDTGVGIPAELLNKVFEPFFTTKELGKGTGLGLSVTYGLVHEMGGRIELESAVGQGTTFTISLPAAEDASDGDAAPAGRHTRRDTRDADRT